MTVEYIYFRKGKKIEKEYRIEDPCNISGRLIRMLLYIRYCAFKGATVIEHEVDWSF